MVISALTLALAGLPPLAFPPDPIEREVEEGARLAREGASLDRLYQDDRRPVGYWFDGKWGQEVEFVTWISPRLVSRWLGYLERRELWEPDEIGRRWEELRRRLDGKMTFVVWLSAYPKRPMLELTPERPPVTTDLEGVKFFLTAGSAAQRARGELLARWQSRRRDKLGEFRWWLYVPFGELLTPVDRRLKDEPPFPLGDYHAAYYLVEGFSMPEMFEGQRFELRILSPRKERIAAFGRGTRVGALTKIMPFNWRLFDPERRARPNLEP